MSMKRSTPDGFTLVEMAIILLVIGIFFAAGAQIYATYVGNLKYQKTEDSLIMVEGRLQEFFGRMGRYPCPADRTLAQDDANYGLESCRATVLDPCPAGTICTNLGTRDTMGDTDTDNDYIMIGALPVRTLSGLPGNSKFSETAGIDGFDMKIEYAVTELMTRGTFASPANVQMGVIDIRDENDRSVVIPEQSAHYALISHGENRRGAYARNGAFMGDCHIMVLGVPTTATGQNGILESGIPPELENCDDDDGLFVMGLRTQSEGDYFDDLIIAGKTNIASFWRMRVDTSMGTQDVTLYNTNLGNVGVGTTTPISRLHVQGDLMADERIEVPEDATPNTGYCDTAGSYCVKPSFLGGTADPGCPAGQVARGFGQNALICEPLPSINFACPVTVPRQFATGFRINSAGVATPICSTL